MSDLLASYAALSPHSPRDEVSAILRSIVDGVPLNPGNWNLIQLLLDDVRACSDLETQTRLTANETALALLAVKNLGKSPVGSQIIATPANLSFLLAFCQSSDNDPEARMEGLKCIANALLLIEPARSTWLEVGGGHACVQMLERSTSLVETFVVSRLFYFSTISPTTAGSFIKELVEDRALATIIGSKLLWLAEKVNEDTEMSREATTDFLKFVFNILVHYPKMVRTELQNPDAASHLEDTEPVMGDYWSPRLDPILPALLHVFASLSATSPCPIEAPLTHVVHNLITVPVSPRLRPFWFGDPLSTTGETGNEAFVPTTVPDTLFAAYKLLDACLEHYFPGATEPDDASQHGTCKEGNEATLDHLISPLVVLLARMCLGDEVCRSRMRDWLVPADLDRTRPLESRPTLLGRALRLLVCSYYPRLKSTMGEMLFAMCDSNALSLSSHFGYGNVAGFLFQRGLLTAPPPAASTQLFTTGSGEQINPITGTVEGPKPSLEMTDEEKEREAEKLFVLLNRLEKTTGFKNTILRRNDS